jgi:type IV secretion system protein VirB9
LTHTFGGEDLWELSNKDNNIFVRPINALSDTNLTLITNLRTYYLILHYIGGTPTKDEAGKTTEKFIETPWSVRQATVGLIYKYPFEEMEAANKLVEQRRVRDALEAQDTKSPKNIDYKMSDDPGIADITPMNIWDNHRFTSFKFPENADLPVVTVIGPDRKEQVVNTHVEGPNRNIIVAEMTAREWRIRLGDKVIGVVNGAYNPSLGANPNGTVAPEVKRVLLNRESQ